jgi:hypothetical protein
VTPAQQLSFEQRWKLPQQDYSKPFLWDVLGEVMLPVVLRWQACQERHIELVEAVHANPDDASYARRRGGDDRYAGSRSGVEFFLQESKSDYNYKSILSRH